MIDWLIPYNIRSGGKLSKERITALITVFADGTTYKPLIIGKSQHPRCFKNININQLPVKYFANKKSWMTAKIFERYLVDLYLAMVKSNRNILLLLDNATSHPNIELTNVKLVFLPPNCTSELQPLDNGIIQSIKLKYRKTMLSKDLIFQKGSKLWIFLHFSFQTKQSLNCHRQTVWKLYVWLFPKKTRLKFISQILGRASHNF